MNKSFTFYRLFNLNVEECYIGSTTNYKKRMIHHKSDCNNTTGPNYNAKVYKFIRANGGFENWDFEIIEVQNVIKNEALEIENEYRMIYGASLNSDVPGRSDREYYLANKEKIREQCKQYYTANKEQMKDYNKQYNINNKEKISIQCKQYYSANKEQIKECIKQYRTINKEKIRERRTQKYKCECGSIVLKDAKARHERTNKHSNHIRVN